VLSETSSCLFKDRGCKFVATSGQLCQFFAQSGEVRLAELVVAKGQKAEAVFDAKVLEDDFFNCGGWIKWFCALKQNKKRLRRPHRVRVHIVMRDLVVNRYETFFSLLKLFTMIGSSNTYISFSIKI
jgi:hypothetical protein